MTSNTIKEFYVDREAENLTLEQITELHKWCLEAGANNYESVEEWLDFNILGVTERGNTLSLLNERGQYNELIIPFYEVRSHLGLSPLKETPQEGVPQEDNAILEKDIREYVTSLMDVDEEYNIVPDDNLSESDLALVGLFVENVYKGIPIAEFAHYTGASLASVTTSPKQPHSEGVKTSEKGATEPEKVHTESKPITKENIMKKKRVNAGFKSVGDMAQAMFDGSVVFQKGIQLMYDRDEAFVVETGDNNWEDIPQYMWELFAEMEIEKEVQWWEDIDPENLPLCKVWGGGWCDEDDNVVKYIKFYSEGNSPFGDSGNKYYGHAIPTGLFQKDIDALG